MSRNVTVRLAAGTQPDPAAEVGAGSPLPARAPRGPLPPPVPLCASTGLPESGSSRAAKRRSPGRALVLLALAAGSAIVLLGLSATRVPAQVSWLDFEDGDILNVSTAQGPPAGTPFFQVDRSTLQNSSLGSVLVERLRVEYGLSDWLSAGVSGVHLEQIYHQFTKRGPGDTDLSLKAYVQPWPDLPLRAGLRQTLSLPTGYEKERDGLAPFTSRQYDYSGQALLQCGGQKFSVILEPGVLLPGGGSDRYFTSGLGVTLSAPWGINLESEYYTRWSLDQNRNDSEIYGAARRNLLFGLAAELGITQRLLQEEQVRPEFHLGFSLGRERAPEEPYVVQTAGRGSVGLLIHPIETSVLDPHGVARVLTEDFRTDHHAIDQGVLVYARVAAGETIPLLDTRHYEMNIRILEIREGEVGGPEILEILQAPRSRTTITAVAELIAPDGYSVLRRAQYEGRASRTLSFVLAPESGSVASTQTPSEVLDALRSEAVKDLAGRILDDTIKTISNREGE